MKRRFLYYYANFMVYDFVQAKWHHRVLFKIGNQIMIAIVKGRKRNVQR